MKQVAKIAVILLHEIYGKNRHILTVQQQLEGAGYPVYCPNLLYNREKPFAYSEQSEAYNSFKRQGGFAAAAKKVSGLLHSLRDEYAQVFLVGFSIGATLTWLAGRAQEAPDGIVGFYGSRIRDYTDQMPACPALLVFPRSEESFDVGGLIRTLKGKANLEIRQANALHGFVDPWSVHYNEDEAKAAFEYALQFIRSHSKA